MTVTLTDSVHILIRPSQRRVQSRYLKRCPGMGTPIFPATLAHEPLLSESSARRATLRHRDFPIDT